MYYGNKRLVSSDPVRSTDGGGGVDYETGSHICPARSVAFVLCTIGRTQLRLAFGKCRMDGDLEDDPGGSGHSPGEK